MLSDKLSIHQTWLNGPHRVDTPIRTVQAAVHTFPTRSPEADGTIAWDKTTMVLVQIAAGDVTGLGYTYAHASAADVIHDTLRPAIEGQDAMNVSECWLRMCHQVRNVGLEGIASMAISAVDTALWDLKAKLLHLPLVRLLGQVRDAIPVYGSGGFTTYTVAELEAQLGAWAHAGMSRVKMKIGTDAHEDEARVKAARIAIGPDVALFVDANGAWHPRQALAMAQRLANLGVTWFEEPVDQHDITGTRFVRDHAPASMDVAGGEYGYASTLYFDRLRDAVDVMQADVTRCGGITGFLRVAALCETHLLPLSSHCAPALHAHLGCAVSPMCHAEYFFDHVRIEQQMFDGAIPACGGELTVDLSRPGLGLELKTGE